MFSSHQDVNISKGTLLKILGIEVAWPMAIVWNNAHTAVWIVWHRPCTTKLAVNSQGNTYF